MKNYRLPFLLFPLILLLGVLPLQAQREIGQCTAADLQLALAGGGHVTFGCDGILTLTNTIVISANTTLDGTGQNVTLDGVGQARLFFVNPGIELVLRNLTLANGAVTGASGTNGLPGDPAFGAAIYNNQGRVVLENSTFSSHQARGGNGGDGRSATGLFGDRHGQRGGAGGFAAGGAIYNLGSLTVTNCHFSGNDTRGGDGGAGGNGAAVGNGGDGGRGGNGGFARGAAIFNGATASLMIVDSTFQTNNATGSLGGPGGSGAGVLGFDAQPGSAAEGTGGAIFNEGGQFILLNSTFLGNTSLGAGGAHGHPGRSDNIREGRNGAPGSPALGGAIANHGLLWMTNSTFFGNIVFAGDGGDGGAGATLGFGADGGDGGPGGDGLGGGLYNSALGRAVLVNNTFSNNSARGGSGGMGGPPGGVVGSSGRSGPDGFDSGGAVFGPVGTVEIKNSILANSLSGGDAGGTLHDGGFNLISDTSMAALAPGTMVGTNPLLQSLADQGGNTWTMALATNSPAINAITAPNRNGAPATDQRGAAREHPFDIGAFEFGASGVIAPVPPVSPIPPLSINPGTNNVIISWPVAETDLILETRTNLAPDTSWTPVPADPVVNGNQSQIIITPAAPHEFFRLRKP
jgi:hypothetical protein